MRSWLQNWDQLQLQHPNLDLRSGKLRRAQVQEVRHPYSFFSTASFFTFTSLLQHFISHPTAVLPQWKSCVVSVPTCSPPPTASDRSRQNAPSHCGVAMPTGGSRVVAGWLWTFLRWWKAHLESGPGGRAWLSALCLQEIRAEGSQGARLHNVSSFLSSAAERRFSTRVLTPEILQDFRSGGETARLLQKTTLFAKF